MTAVTEEDAIRAAMSIAGDVAEGRLTPQQLEQESVDAARAMFARVVGPEDALWELQVQVMRDVLAIGAGSVIKSAELAEWSAVAAAAEGPPPAPPSWIETALAIGAGDETEED